MSDSETLRNGRLFELREKVSASEHLSVLGLDDSFLLKYLRAQHFDTDLALTHIRGYFALRQKHPSLFQLPSQVVDTFEDGIFSFLPRRSPDGELLVLMRAAAWKPDKYNMTHVMSGLVPFYEVMASEDESIQRNGVVEIFDMRNFTYASALKIWPSDYKLFSELMESGLPIRYNAIHVCFEDKVVDLAWNIIKRFLTENFKNRIQFHGSDLSKLHEHVPTSVLPPELGGTIDGPLNTSWSTQELNELDGKVSKYWSKYRPSLD